MVRTNRHIFSGKVEIESNLVVGSNIKLDDTVGLVLGHGNIFADGFVGDGSRLTGVLTSLEDAAAKGENRRRHPAHGPGLPGTRGKSCRRPANSQMTSPALWGL